MAAAKVDDETAVLEKIAALEPHQETAARLHAIILEAAPALLPRLWYGMPGYARAKKSPVICFFRVDDGLLTFGLTEHADLTPDDDATDQLVGSAWFVNGLDEATEARIAGIVRKAAG